MAISKVAHSVVEMVVELADRGDYPLAQLCAGLPVTEGELRRKTGGLEWELFVELLARLEVRLGYARMEAICAHVPDIAPTSHRFLSNFVSPTTLFRFVGRLMGPSMYPMIAAGYDEREREDGQLVAYVRMRLREGFRDCHTLFKLNAPALASVPIFLGYPAMPYRAEVFPRGGDYWLELPPSKTLVARLRRRPAGMEEALREVEEDKARLLEANEQLWRRRDTEFRVRLDTAATRWGLSDRQVEVLSGLARGLSNKALTKELGCSVKTIETHVTELLRRAGKDSRLALVAAFWRDL